MACTMGYIVRHVLSIHRPWMSCIQHVAKFCQMSNSDPKDYTAEGHVSEFAESIEINLNVPYHRPVDQLCGVPFDSLPCIDASANTLQAINVFLHTFSFEDTGLGQLPVLVVDGQELPQSGAIYRFIGLSHGFYPSDVWECARVDVVMETVVDFDPDLRKIFLSSEDEKPGVIKTFATEGAPKRFDILEKLLKQNNEGNGWFVGDKITVADVMVFCMLHDTVPTLTGLQPGNLDLKAFPALQDFVNRFKSEKKISDWIQRRPVTPF